MKVMISDNLGDWVEKGNCFEHSSGGFFRLWSNYEDYGVILDQVEIGCLGLIIVRVANSKDFKFLLQRKNEPGTLGDYEYSTTVQATRSNLNRIHGGSKVKYSEYFQDESYLLHCSLQIEQADAYIQKCNANIIKIIEEVNIVIDDNYELLSLGEVIDIFLTDSKKISMDLRSVLSIYLSVLKYNISVSEIKKNNELAFKYFLNSTKSTDINQQSFLTFDVIEKLRSSESIKIPHNSVYKYDFFLVQADKREVSHWVQPLLIKNLPHHYDLNVFNDLDDVYLQPDVCQTISKNWCFLHACQLLNTPSGVTQYFEFCEEGGRFFRVKNNYSVNVKNIKYCDNGISGKHFVTRYLLPGLATSIELRTLWFVHLLGEYGEKSTKI